MTFQEPNHRNRDGLCAKLVLVLTSGWSLHSAVPVSTDLLPAVGFDDAVVCGPFLGIWHRDALMSDCPLHSAVPVSTDPFSTVGFDYAVICR